MYQITFTDDKGRYFWYVLTVDIDSPESNKTLKITNEIRKATELKIDIPNN